MEECVSCLVVGSGELRKHHFPVLCWLSNPIETKWRSEYLRETSDKKWLWVFAMWLPLHTWTRLIWYWSLSEVFLSICSAILHTWFKIWFILNFLLFCSFGLSSVCNLINFSNWWSAQNSFVCKDAGNQPMTMTIKSPHRRKQNE